MDQTKEMIARAHDNDKEARDSLVTGNLGLVHSIVRRFCDRGVASEDLFQIGVIGLIKAIDNFNLDLDVAFSTYAVPMITGEIKRFLRDDGMIKVSRTIKENAKKTAQCAETLSKKLGRDPTTSEIAKEAGISVEDLALSQMSAYTVESIYKSAYQSDDNETAIIDKLEDDYSLSEDVVSRLTVSSLIEDLSERDKKIIIMRYFDDYTQSQVADRLGISQVQVSRMEKKILLGMRERLNA